MLQYFHYNYTKIPYAKRYTIAVDVPPKKALLDLLKNEGPRVLSITVGSTVCHPDDQYNKKKGRLQSTRILTPVNFRLTAVDFDGKRSFFYFRSEDDSLGIALRTHEESDNCYFIEAIWRI